MQDQRLPEPRFDQRRPDQSRRFKHESFTDRIETGAQFKPETENIPSLLSIVHSRDPKQAQRLVELYLNNRDLGVTALPEAERDAICLKIMTFLHIFVRALVMFTSN